MVCTVGKKKENFDLYQRFILKSFPTPQLMKFFLVKGFLRLLPVSIDHYVR